MDDTESPYRSPSTLVEDSEDKRPARTTRLGVTGFVVLPLLGGFVGFASYIAVALAVESHNAPAGSTLSYGQQAVLISLPICTTIGFATGLGVAFSLVQRYMVSIIVLSMVFLCGFGVVNSIWNDQIARYGRDASEVVLYWPPLALTILALVAALTVSLIAAVRRSTGTAPGADI